MSRRVIEGNYARLKGLKESAILPPNYLSRDFGQDYNDILAELRNSLDDGFNGFDLSQYGYWHKNTDDSTYKKTSFISKVNQLISYLEAVHNASSKIVEIGSVYNLIKDDELKSRCADLLSASEHFDRVINQATQVLEDRIKEKAPQFASMTGGHLINAVIKQEPSDSVIVFSQDTNEQHGYASLFRGIVAVFRNPSHHQLLDNVTREEALQICAFIDNLLRLLSNATVAD